jgi:hypothetical protein
MKNKIRITIYFWLGLQFLLILLALIMGNSFASLSASIISFMLLAFAMLDEYLDRKIK